MDAAEVVQAYIVYPNKERMPLKELKYFKKIIISRGATKNATISIPVEELKKWDLALNKWVLYPGNYKLEIASNAKDVILTTQFEIQ